MRLMVVGACEGGIVAVVGAKNESKVRASDVAEIARTAIPDSESLVGME